MSQPGSTSFEDTIRERIDLSFDRVQKIARDANLAVFAEEILRQLLDFKENYVLSRIAQQGRETPPDKNAAPNEEYADWLEEGDDGWPKGAWDELFTRKVGQPGHDALLELHDFTAELWTSLPLAPGKKRRNRWAPVFMKIEDETIPHNEMAKLFYGIARLFDRAYLPRHCRSVVDRVKNQRRSPEGKARLKERRRKAAARHRQSKKVPPSHVE